MSIDRAARIDIICSVLFMEEALRMLQGSECIYICRKKPSRKYLAYETREFFSIQRPVET